MNNDLRSDDEAVRSGVHAPNIAQVGRKMAHKRLYLLHLVLKLGVRTPRSGRHEDRTILEVAKTGRYYGPGVNVSQ